MACKVPRPRWFPLDNRAVAVAVVVRRIPGPQGWGSFPLEAGRAPPDSVGLHCCRSTNIRGRDGFPSFRDKSARDACLDSSAALRSSLHPA
jgi:hypothetical protein